MQHIALACREKVLVPYTKPFITFLGNPKNPPVIMWDDRAATHGKDGKPVGTVGSATVAVESDYFMASGIVFRVRASIVYIFVHHRSTMHICIALLAYIYAVNVRT